MDRGAAAAAVQVLYTSRSAPHRKGLGQEEKRRKEKEREIILSLGLAPRLRLLAYPIYVFMAVLDEVVK